LTEELAARDDMIVCEGVNKWFGDFQALDGITAVIKEREVVVVLGPSGSGKSTWIRCINRLEAHQEGRILIDGVELTNDLRNIERIRSEVGMVFQQFNLFPHLTVLDNITLAPIWVRKKPKAEAEDLARSLLERVGIPEQAEKFPGQLSGGQQQRVAIARALVFEPALVLMDEPLGALDRRLREEMQYEVRRIQRSLGVTVVYVTHDQQEAMAMSDRVAVFQRGRIEQVAPPEALYEEAIGDLESALRSADPEGFGDLHAAMEQERQALDAAIADSRRRAAAAPDDEEAQETLFGSLRRKLDLFHNTLMLMRDMERGDSETAQDRIDAISGRERPDTG